MRIDLYTKTILTLIALTLAIIAVKPVINPETKAQAQGTLAGYQVISNGTGLTFFDEKAGDVWYHDFSGYRDSVHYIGKITDPKTVAQR
jgi:hypothetical protein